MNKSKDSKSDICAIIPARGGSKSIPGKNIKSLGNIPLIAYSITAGLQSQQVDRVIVSTDDERIAKIAEEWGAEVPFMRPARLAQDHTTDLPVFEHALRWLEKEQNYTPELIVQLRPTSPFRPRGCVDQAIQKMQQTEKADSLRAITPSGQNPYKMWRIEDQWMEPLLSADHPEPYNMPRQKLPATYWQTGIIEVIRRSTILEKASMTGQHIVPFLLDPVYAVDLDTALNWQFAEFLLQEAELDIIEPFWNGLEMI